MEGKKYGYDSLFWEYGLYDKILNNFSAVTFIFSARMVFRTLPDSPYSQNRPL